MNGNFIYLLVSNSLDSLTQLFLYQGKRIKCSPAQAKNRLFIGNVPRNWGEEDMRTAITNVGPGVITIELVKVGPCFVFLTHPRKIYRLSL